MNNYLFIDDEFADIPELKNKRIKVNRLRYQQVKEALRLNRKYRHSNFKSIGEDFDLSPKTVSKIKGSKSYNKYLNRNKNNERPDGDLR